MPEIEKSHTATLIQRNDRRLSGSRTDKAASGSATMQTGSAQDDYDRKVSLIRKAFGEISRLCFEHGYTLTPEDWRVLDQARLDEPSLSYEELRERLAALYLRIKRACQAVRA